MVTMDSTMIIVNLSQVLSLETEYFQNTREIMVLSEENILNAIKNIPFIDK